MKYPKLEEIPTSRDWIDVFLGYNHNERIGSGEFYDMTNLTSDEYPVLCPRKSRTQAVSKGVGYEPNYNGIIGKTSLCHIEDGTFYINGIPLETTSDRNFNITNKGIKQLISMGAYVVIFPDKMYVNTEDHSDYGAIEEKYSYDPEGNQEITYHMSMLDGNEYDIETGTTEPVIDGESEKIPAWIDTSSKPHVLRVYSASTKTWSAVATSYVKIGAPGIGVKFAVGDSVTISGITNIDYNKDGSEREEKCDDRLALNGSFVIMSKGEDYVVITGIIDAVTEQRKGKIKVERLIPDMDYIVEANNRLWGCKYGIVTKSDGSTSMVNEIYASKLGDFKNWYVYSGTAADSYAVNVGTDGGFTGAISYLGYPIFFKENCMHKIYGNYPANYQVQTTTCRGVQEGCSKSLDIVNEVLYYKSKSGIMAYSGSLPIEVSEALGDIAYENAVAGHLGNKYYVSMCKTGTEDYRLFVYDTKKKLWHKEDETQVSDFTNCRGDLYFINYNAKRIETVGGTVGDITEPVICWEAETGYIGTDSPDKKYISKIDVRMQLAADSTVSFYAEYDSSGEFEYLFAMTGKNLQSFSVPVRPKRCDHLRLKIIGEGEAKIFSICKTLEWGSSR